MAPVTRALPAVVLALGAIVLTTGAAAPEPKVPNGSNAPGVHILQAEDHAKGPACPEGWVCFFRSTDFREQSIAVLPGTEVPDIARVTFPNGKTLKESVSAWVNNSPVPYCWYEKTKHEGAKHDMKPFGSESRVSPNDALASFKPC
ncbi:peptidase inhibitor family I36 protein [Streptomyces sp. NPDC007369]|uniref:peptidase inhibitor family I36 protein n=1 Tax=Streptomyces sp. NPDC007369 TaxID=3154589 RepID=UPI003406416A